MASRTVHARGARLLVGVLSFALLAACSSGGPAEPVPSLAAPTPTVAAPSTSPSPADEAKTDALDAYRGMWQDFSDAGHTSDWQSPKLGQHATGIALTNLSRSLYADHRNGVITKGEPKLNPTASSATPAADPTKVIVADCGDSTNALKYRADNGQLADNDPGGRRSINAIVDKQSDGSWKVSDFGVHGIGTC